MVEGVEHADEQAGEAEQDHDREEHARQPDHQIGVLGVEARREQRHQDRCGEDEQPGDQPQRQQHDVEKRAGDAKRLAFVAPVEQLGEDRHESGLQGGVGEQRTDEVRNEERGLKRGHRAGDAEDRGGDDLAQQADDSRQAGRDREEHRRERQAAVLGLGLGVRGLGVNRILAERDRLPCDRLRGHLGAIRGALGMNLGLFRRRGNGIVSTRILTVV